MDDETARNLHGEIAALRGEVAAYRAERASAGIRPRHGRSPQRGRGRRPGRLVATLALTLLVALVPAALLAADPAFSDLDTAGAVHRADIRAIGNAGITTGVDDPASADPNVKLYNPKDVVTREQMASFLARTAGLGANPPVANARTAQTVPDGSITPAKLGGGGATAGQVLTATGGGVAFRDPPSGGGASNAIRVARGAPIQAGTFPLTPTFQITGRVTLTAPSAGFVIVTAAMTVSAFSGPTDLGRVRLRDEGSGVFSPDANARLTPPAPPPAAQNVDELALTPTFVFQVAAAGPQAFVLEAKKDAAGGGFFWEGVQISAIFVPFGSTGTTTP